MGNAAPTHGAFVRASPQTGPALQFLYCECARPRRDGIRPCASTPGAGADPADGEVGMRCCSEGFGGAELKKGSFPWS